MSHSTAEFGQTIRLFVAASNNFLFMAYVRMHLGWGHEFRRALSIGA